MEGFKFIFKKTIDFYEKAESHCFYSLKYCLNSPDCYKSKIQYFNTYINKNSIATNEDIIEIENVYNKSRKIYSLFSKFAFNYKYKKALNFSNDTDFYLNDFNDFKQNQLYILYEPCLNCKYKFKVADLLRIIETSLSYNQDFFIKPLWPKNPYINMNLSEYALYNLYIHIALHKTPFMISPLFNLFIKHNFNLIDFEDNTISLLKDYAIKDSLANASTEKKALEIREMLYDYCANYDCDLAYLDYNFPNSVLLEVFSQYLYNYYTAIIFKHTRKGYTASRKLESELLYFIQNNPKFGRKIMRFTQKRYSKDENGNIIKISDKLKFRYEFITEFNLPNVNNINDFSHYINNLYPNNRLEIF